MPRKPAISTSEIAELLSTGPDPGLQRARILLDFCAQLRVPDGSRTANLTFEVMFAKYVSDKMQSGLAAESISPEQGLQTLLESANPTRLVEAALSDPFIRVTFSRVSSPGGGW